MPIVGPFGEVVGQIGARAYVRTVTRLRPSSALMAWKDTPSRRSAWIRWYQFPRGRPPSAVARAPGSTECEASAVGVSGAEPVEADSAAVARAARPRADRCRWSTRSMTRRRS